MWRVCGVASAKRRRRSLPPGLPRPNVREEVGLPGCLGQTSERKRASRVASAKRRRRSWPPGVPRPNVREEVGLPGCPGQTSERKLASRVVSAKRRRRSWPPGLPLQFLRGLGACIATWARAYPTMGNWRQLRQVMLQVAVALHKSDLQTPDNTTRCISTWAHIDLNMGNRAAIATRNAPSSGGPP